VISYQKKAARCRLSLEVTSPALQVLTLKAALPALPKSLSTAFGAGGGFGAQRRLRPALYLGNMIAHTFLILVLLSSHSCILLLR
jgi:hypothetical protein